MKPTPASRSATKILIGQILCLAIAIVTGIVNARMLGAEGRGILGYISVTQGILLSMCQLGTPQAVQYFIRAGRSGVRDILPTVVTLSLAYGVGCAALLSVLRTIGVLGNVALEMTAAQWALAMMALPCVSWSGMALRVILATERYSESILCTVFIAAVKLVLTVALLVWLKWGVMGAVLTGLAASGFGAAYCLTLVWHDLSWRRISTAKGVARGLFRYGIKVWFGSLANTVNARFDQLFLGTFATARDLGVYALGVSIAEQLVLAPNATDQILFNKIAGSKTDHERFTLVEQGNRGLFILALGCFVLIASAAPPLIPLIYGRDFADAGTVCVIYMVACIIYLPVKTLAKNFSGTGRPGLSSRVQFYGALVSIPAFYCGIRWQGVLGAALANVVSCSAMLAVALCYYSRYDQRSPTGLFYLGRSDLSWVVKQLHGVLRPQHPKAALAPAETGQGARIPLS